MTVIHYLKPENWIAYDGGRVLNELAAAKAAIIALQTVPYQKRWVEKLQKMELKREVAGTSRIEGADFSTRELDRAMREETPDELFTRSQRQARAATKTYEWIRTLPPAKPVDGDLIREIHRLIVTDADDDHCKPAALREGMHNVTFGTPPHRGCEGGESCETLFGEFLAAIETQYKAHDPLIQAIAVHYHIAAMHPFGDGNGRTARAVEAFMLRRAGLRETTFIAMSNYYYEEKPKYLEALAAVRASRNDLTPFIQFALRGVHAQATRLLTEIQREIKRELVRSLLADLHARLLTPKKRVIGARQASIISVLLEQDSDSLPLDSFIERMTPRYKAEGIEDPYKALARDGSALINLGAMQYDSEKKIVSVDLDWPTRMTEGELFKKITTMPKASTGWMKR